MENKKLRGGSNAVFYSLFVLGILVLVNIISSRNFKRIDLTDAQI